MAQEEISEANAFGARLALALNALNMSRSQLSAAMEVDKSVVSRWLSGQITPASHNLARISALLAKQRPGFNMMLWTAPMVEFETALGLQPVASTKRRLPSMADGSATARDGPSKVRRWSYVAFGCAVAFGLIAAGFLLQQSRGGRISSSSVTDTKQRTGNRAEAMRLTQVALTLLHERNKASNAEAEHLLREAVAADPSYAPAWARLGYATWYPWWWAEQKEPGAKPALKAEALAYIKRALAISPSLAEAQGIMGMVLSDTNEGLPWLEGAIRLDTSDTELWLWLGTARRDQGHDLRGAFDAFARARTLDPSLHTVNEAYLDLVFRLRGPAEAYRELDRMAGSMNDQNWPVQMRADLEYSEGRFTESAATALTALRAHPQNPYWALNRLMLVGAFLGDNDLVALVLKAEPVLHANYDPFNRPGLAFARAQASPETWWDGQMMGAQAAQLVSEGKARLLVTLYDHKFGRPAAFLANCACNPISAGPGLVVALRQSKRLREADEILAGVSQEIAALEAAGDLLLQTRISRARIAALAGDARTAKQQLHEAIQRGWKGQDVGIDPAIDPAFASLRNDAEFRSIVKSLRASQKSEAERLARLDLSGI